MAKLKPKSELVCSFCGKLRSEVHKLIITDNDICICDKCVLSCLRGLIYDKPKPIPISINLTNELHDKIQGKKCIKEQLVSTAKKSILS